MPDEHDDRSVDSAEPDGLAHTMADVARSVAQSAAQSAATTSSGLDRLRRVPLTITVELGRTRMRIADVLRLSEGSVVELSKLAHEPVDVLVNGALFARGEVLVVDETFAVKILEVLEDDLVVDR